MLLPLTLKSVPLPTFNTPSNLTSIVLPLSGVVDVKVVVVPSPSNVVTVVPLPLKLSFAGSAGAV